MDDAALAQVFQDIVGEQPDANKREHQEIVDNDPIDTSSDRYQKNQVRAAFIQAIRTVEPAHQVHLQSPDQPIVDPTVFAALHQSFTTFVKPEWSPELREEVNGIVSRFKDRYASLALQVKP